jgi:hypothetical protein
MGSKVEIVVNFTLESEADTRTPPHPSMVGAKARKGGN